MLYRTIFVLLVLCMMGFQSSKVSKQKPTHQYKVGGRILTSDCYWRGVAPTKEELVEIQQKRPFPGFKLYIKAGLNRLNNPVIDSTATNEQGDFEFFLPRGNYVLLTEHHLNRTVFDTYKNHSSFSYNKDCMERWWREGIVQVNVIDSATDNIDLHFEKCPNRPTAIPCTIPLFSPPPQQQRF